MRSSLLCALLAICFFAQGNNYYVNSRNGDDADPGSIDRPWKSFANLERKKFSPGDSILFARGTSYTGGFSFRSSGDVSRPIVLGSYEAPLTVTSALPRGKLDSVFRKYGSGPAPAFSNPAWSVLNGNIFRIEGSWIVIDGLYFHDNTNPPGSDGRNKNVQKMGAVYLALGTHHITITRCEFFHTPVAVKIKGSYNLVTRNYFHDATDSLAHSWGPIAIMVVKPHNEISWNRVENYGSYGGPYGSDGGVVELDGVDDDFEGRDIRIHHNISINNHGFLECAGRKTDSVYVAFNLSDDTNQFIGGGSMRNVMVLNNTVIRTREPNVDRYVFWTFYPDSTSFTVRNNIFVLPRDIRVYGPFVKPKGHVRSFIGDQVHDHNLYFSGSADPMGGVQGPGDILADPLFADARNGNYRLLPGSPALRAGREGPADSTLDGLPAGAKRDIGAY